ncbi:MAG: glycosyltransferase [Candidatus Marinimicrobia bacterium]|nr:glycosyltransferase [Candidatus Neomarinimicrobiota bacterium]
MTPNIIKNVAIVVQPHQQISNNQNRKYGGVERVVASLIEGLLNRNINVTLYTAKHCHLGCNVRYPIGIIDEEFGQKIEPIQLSTYSRKIREDIDTKNFDVINNHYDPVTFVALQGIRIPTITTLHGPGNEENVNIFGKFYESYFSGVSQAQINLYPSSMNFFGVGFVHNSIDNGHPFSDNKRNYLFSVSRIQPDKGQNNAIEIAKRCRLDLIIAGNSVDEKYFNQKIQPHFSRDLSKPGGEIERRAFINDISKYQTDGRSITYVGEVTEQERDQLMKHAKAFLFPIEVEESFGLVIIEAGIVGTPVIAFNRGAIPEIIEHGKTGFYGNTLDELVGFTERASKIDPAYCRKHIKTYFNNDRMVESYLTLYREVAAINETKYHG